MLKTKSGFTIVELLIVIVVIGILAAITIVAFNGIQDRARASSASSALSHAAKKISVWQVDNVATSPTCAEFNTLSNSSGSSCSFTVGPVNYQYTAGTSGAYCITATNGTTSYKITEATQPTAGGCAGHGVGGTAAITNMSTNPSVESNTTSFSAYGTIARVSSPAAFHGSYSLMVTPIANATNGNFTQSVTGLTSGTTYTYSFYIYRTSIAEQLNSFIDNVGAYAISAPVNTWTRVSQTFTYTSYSNWGVRQPAATASPAPFYIDGITYTQGTTPPTYADGNSAGWIWNGTPNNATSTGPPL